MDWTAAGPVRPSRGGLTANEPDEAVHDARPDEHGPRHPDSTLRVATDRPSVGSRVHGYTLLVVILAVQLAWLTTLGYALLRLFS